MVQNSEVFSLYIARLILYLHDVVFVSGSWKVVLGSDEYGF
jgi:hypothetical protein